MSNRNTIVTVRWEYYAASQHYNSRIIPFYAFSRGGNLLYIGMTYEQEIGAEINASIRRLGLNRIGLAIHVGAVNYEKSDIQRVTKQLVKDCECLMIYNYQPVENTQCKQAYTGRTGLRVKHQNAPF